MSIESAAEATGRGRSIKGNLICNGLGKVSGLID
jgi:hypothetical protein